MECQVVQVLVVLLVRQVLLVHLEHLVVEQLDILKIIMELQSQLLME